MPPVHAHWEQDCHVVHRLQRHGAGRRIDHAIGHDALAEAMMREAGAHTAYVPVPTDGARRMAERPVSLL